ncbi:hypothetical protein HY638_05740 [Candidatus Woesearchaeota archaeon]|nr:hypothetical protein [Candidatus Woesearchaeota archaeon]
MNSFPPHKLRSFVRHLCIAAARHESGEVHAMSRDEMLREIGMMKSDLSRLSRKGNRTYNVSRQSEFIIAGLRSRVNDIEEKISRRDFEVKESLDKEHDRIVFLTQAMDSLRDKIAALGMGVVKDEESMKGKLLALERRFGSIRKSVDRKTASRIGKRLSLVKSKMG